jgi:hypothetical protein
MPPCSKEVGRPVKRASGQGRHYMTVYAAILAKLEAETEQRPGRTVEAWILAERECVMPYDGVLRGEDPSGRWIVQERRAWQASLPREVRGSRQQGMSDLRANLRLRSVQRSPRCLREGGPPLRTSTFESGLPVRLAPPGPCSPSMCPQGPR